MGIIRHVKCPVPDCNHSGELLTNNHCEAAHGMTRKDLVREYGEANVIKNNDLAAKKNRELQQDTAAYYNPSYASQTPRARQAREQKRSQKLERVKNSSQYRR